MDAADTPAHLSTLLRAELDSIRAEIAQHPTNAWAREAGWEPVYTASPAARIAIIGQAPGRRAQQSGLPWDDLSGARLRRWLGVSDEEFYDPELFAILPMDFYYPGKGARGDLPPRKEFAAHWHPPLLERLPRVRLTLLIGSYAQKHYLGARAGSSLTETVRSYRDYLPEFLPLAHPSPLNFRWLKTNPWFEEHTIEELRPLVRESVSLGE